MPEQLPKLFKKTITGAIQQWQVGIEDETVIVTTFGQVGGAQQTVKDSVRSGKNQGRKNETDPGEQAFKEASALWLKKKKAGYVESFEDAESGITDSEVIHGGIIPMTAKVYEDHSKKLEFPVAVQPKLDGHRCIAMIDESGRATLWSRSRKRIYSAPHIEKEVGEVAKKLGLSGKILDGEIYNHGLRHEFERITSIARKIVPDKDHRLLQYHIYDIVSDSCFTKRSQILGKIKSESLRAVETIIVPDEKGVMKMFGKFVEEGYEGAMVRKLKTPYTKHRCTGLLKVKGFQESEFKIVGVEEGRGKLQGHAGAFVCTTNARVPEEFRVKMSGETKMLKTYFENFSEYLGKMLTVKYQGLTVYGTPRFPVGLRIREDL